MLAYFIVGSFMGGVIGFTVGVLMCASSKSEQEKEHENNSTQ